MMSSSQSSQPSKDVTGPSKGDTASIQSPGRDEEAAPAWERGSDDGVLDPDSGVKRGLKNRHLSMMALAGIIGPGLLVGAGGALNSGGPASLIIGFGVIGESTTHICPAAFCASRVCCNRHAAHQ